MLMEAGCNWTRSAKLWAAVPDGGPMSPFCLICFLPAYHLGVSVGAPVTCTCKQQRGQARGAPFISILISPVGGSTNWKAVVVALHFSVTTGSGSTCGGEWACAFVPQGSCRRKKNCLYSRITFSQRHEQRQELTGLNQITMSNMSNSMLYVANLQQVSLSSGDLR